MRLERFVTGRYSSSLPAAVFPHNAQDARDPPVRMAIAGAPSAILIASGAARAYHTNGSMQHKRVATSLATEHHVEGATRNG